MAKAFAAVLGMSPTGLYAVRELGEAGIRVLGVDTARQAGGYSKHLAADLGCLLEPDERVLTDRLLAVAEREGARGVLMPTSDSYIEFIARNASRLSAHYDFQSSYASATFSSIVDKGRFTGLCSAHGLDAPSFWETKSPDLAGLADRVAYPCLIKPAVIHQVKEFMAGRKAFIARDATDFRRVAATAAACESDWLVQEIVPGPESNITVFGGYVAKDGSMRQAFTGRKLRQYPPGFGSASLARSERLEETLGLSRRFLAAIGYRGVASLEFKLDERDGKLKVIELNPRPALWYALAHHAGKRIALAAYDDLSGAVPGPEREQENGVLWRYLLKDLYSAAFYAVKGDGFVLPPPIVDGARRSSRAVGPVFDLSDPLPVWGEMLNGASKLMSRGLR